MNAILSIASKELRALFQSQIAVLFLALFEVFSLVTFFAIDRFFARNLADLSPFFSWLPIQLILLVSAVSMRSWAEERKSGTLEVLLTLPVRTIDLVLGKFVAGMVLVGLALLFTLPLPITVSLLGPLDWGPVVGGYAGAMLLAAAYLAIGLCVSARTNNQVLALMGTVAIGGLLYAIGTENVQTLLGATGGGIAADLGSGSRFESIARGVIDLRDLVYYGSITTFFLALNTYFLDSWRIDPQGTGKARLRGLQVILALVLLNSVAANLWTAPIQSARLDLTENKDYSIHQVTIDILNNLDNPITIVGVFSEQTHPKLQPRIPQLRALLKEFEYASPNVTVDFLDPSSDDDLADTLEQDFGIRPVPMPVADRNETRIVNSWFHVLLKYGDQHIVIPFSDLVEVNVVDDEVKVRLRDPEYDITKAIRKVAQDFVSTETLVSKLPKDSTLTLYTTPANLDPQGLENLETMRTVAAELAALPGNLTFEEVDPSTDRALIDTLAQTYGVRPALSLQTGKLYYLHLILRSGDQAQRVFPRGKLEKNDLQTTLDAALKRAVPGQLKTVAIYTETPVPPPPQPGQQAPPAAPKDYQILAQALGQRFEVTPDVDLSSGSVPDQVDVLVVGKPGALTPMEQLALDQFLLRGGSLIALAGRYRANYGRGGFEAQPEPDALFEMLAHYGVDVESEQVLDLQSGTLALPVQGRLVQFPYPYWIDIRPDNLPPGHLAFTGLPSFSMPWSSPMKLTELPDGITGEVMIHSSDKAWRRDTDDLMPDFASYPNSGFPPPSKQGKDVLAVSLKGRFQSFFTDDTRPDLPGAIESPVAEGTLIVLGSSELVGDVLLDYASRSPAGKIHINNGLLLQNLVDWSLEDTDLLSIRNAGHFSRTLEHTDADLLFQIELLNYLLVLLPLPLLYFLSRRRRAVPHIPEASS